MHKSKKKWICVDCGEVIRYEHYFVKNEVWFDEAGMTEQGMLHVVCLERRILRLLTPEDFTDVFINNPKNNAMTDVLRSRITGENVKDWGVDFRKLISNSKPFTTKKKVHYE